MRQDLFDHGGIFDARDHLHRTTTVVTGLDINLEHPLQPLRLTLIATWGAGVGSSVALACVGHAGPASLVHVAGDAVQRHRGNA